MSQTCNPILEWGGEQQLRQLFTLRDFIRRRSVHHQFVAFGSIFIFVDFPLFLGVFLFLLFQFFDPFFLFVIRAFGQNSPPLTVVIDRQCQNNEPRTRRGSL